MAKSHLLTFEAFPERVVLEGFSEEVLGGLGMFMAGLAVTETPTAPYRIVVRAGGQARLAATKNRIRRPWRRHVHHDGEDMVVMPRGRVHLAPGRPEAVVEWTEGGGGVDGFVVVTLLEAAMSHALALRGRVVNHAAAFEIDGAGLLAVGPTRSGKSTVCSAVLAAGGAVVSDDSVILGLDDGGNTSAGALRRDLWVRDGSEDLLPAAMRSSLWEAASFSERRWGLERAAFPDSFRTRVRPEAIVLLRRDLRIRGYVLRRAHAGGGLARLILASSALFLSGRYPLERDRCLPRLVELANDAPCFEARMGRALVDDPVATVRRLAGDLLS